MSNLLRVPTGFIMKVNAPHIQIFTTNEVDTNPYHAGQNFELDGLYCEEVMKSDNLLCVPDALKDPEWDDNPEIPAGFIYYLGYPIYHNTLTVIYRGFPPGPCLPYLYIDTGSILKLRLNKF